MGAVTSARGAHKKLVFNRRVSVLSQAIADLLPANARVLDIGCGSGDVAVAVMRLRPDVQIEGVDVLVRDAPAIPVQEYDGKTIPFADGAFDVAMMIDVLHHTDDPANVLAEARRVSTRGVVIKDHFRNGLLAGPTLRFMDWVGNAPHGVRLPYNYLSRSEWAGIWQRLGLRATKLTDRVPLYPRPFSWLFGRKLHFTTLLEPAA